MQNIINNIMMHYVNTIEYRTAEDGKEYTFEEFKEYYGDTAEYEWAKTVTEYNLYLYVDPEFRNLGEADDIAELKLKYEEAVKKWNEKMAFSKYPDAGFDIFTPADQIRNPTDTSKHYKINFNIKTAMYKNNKPVSFTMHPRSSIYKTPFRLTNNTGIIDSGYRGNLGAVFDVLTEQEQGTQQKPFERYVQVCAPSLEPFCVHLVENEDDLGLDTERGTGGFGSTGR